MMTNICNIVICNHFSHQHGEKIHAKKIEKFIMSFFLNFHGFIRIFLEINDYNFTCKKQNFSHNAHMQLQTL